MHALALCSLYTTEEVAKPQDRKAKELRRKYAAVFTKGMPALMFCQFDRSVLSIHSAKRICAYTRKRCKDTDYISVQSNIK